MESSSWPEGLPSNWIKATHQLTRGQQLTNKLREMLGQPEAIESDLKSVDGVVVQILEMFDNTLSILNSYTFNEDLHIQTDDMKSFTSSLDDKQSQNSSEHVKFVRSVKNKRGCYNRRNNSSTLTKVTSTLFDDGYAWRKYGQKVIFNAKYQRNYFRCTHKDEQGCKATKQVQKTDDEPPKYKTTYNGHHTCKKVEKASQIILDFANCTDNQVLLSFETITTENRQVAVGPGLHSVKEIMKEDFSSLGLNHEQEQVSSSKNYTPWDPLMELSDVPLQPMSMMSPGLDQEYMTSSGLDQGNEMHDMLESYDIGDYLFELC